MENDKSAGQSTDAKPDKSSKPMPKSMDDASNSRESNKPDNKTAKQNDQGK
jgi:hypothetical protein